MSTVQKIASLSLLVILCTTARAGLEVQPSPETDPTEEGLYLYTAGSNPTFKLALQDDMTICPDDYHTGFNVLCIAESPKVLFYVNSNLIATEYRKPYYLAGNVGERVRPWTSYPRSAWIRCKLPGPKRNIRAHVFFRC